MADALDIPDTASAPPTPAEGPMDFEKMMTGLVSGTIDPETKAPINPEPKKPATEKVADKPPDKKPDPATTAKPLPEALFKKQETTAAAPTDDIQTPEFKNPKSAEQWEKLRALKDDASKRLQEREAEAATLKARLAELEKAAPELEDMRKRYAEMEKTVKMAKIELHPEFRQKFVDGRASLIDHAKRLLTNAGGEGDALVLALGLSGKARIDALTNILDGVPNFVQSQIAQAVTNIETLDADADRMRSDAAKTYEEYTRGDSEKQRQTLEQQTRQIEQGWSEALRALPAELEVLNDSEFPWWNDQKRDILKGGEDLYRNNSDPRVAAIACVKAKACDAYRDMFLSAREELAAEKERSAAKQAELDAFYKSAPGAGGGRGTNSGATDVTKMGFEERFAHELNGN